MVFCNRLKLQSNPFSLSKVIAALSWFSHIQGWSGGAMVLGKLPVPGRPTNLD